MKKPLCALLLLTVGIYAMGATAGSKKSETEDGSDLTGAWRGSVQFTSGAFASTKDLEFMYVFNLGGTMTKSSNYDGAPPVPPA